MSLKGGAVSGSGGIVFGIVQKLEKAQDIIPEYVVEPFEKDVEVKRFQQAIKQAVYILEGEIRALELNSQADNLIPILQTHQMMLQDPELVMGTEVLIRKKSINVEWALKQCLASFTDAFAQMDDVYLKSRKADIEQVGKRIQNCLGETEQPFSQENSIVIASDFSPSDVVEMWRAGVAGFVATQGGKDSHAMIVARGIGLSGLVGVQSLYTAAEDGDALILDAEHHEWLLNPTASERKEMCALQASFMSEQKILQTYAKPTEFANQSIPLLANIEFNEEVDIANQYGVDGIGLFRTEFLFMQSHELPTESEQTDYYTTIVKGMKGKPVTFRLLDVGTDKLGHVQALFTDYDAENPALGLRGVRMLLHKPEILEAQLKAILSSSMHGNVSVLVPMVVTVAEMLAVRHMMENIKLILGITKQIPLGCMIEVPAAAIIADDLAEVSDFFSVGSNDLLQYALAVDRSDEYVAYLYDAKHPAIKKFIQMAVDSAHKHQIPVTICGELAASTDWTQCFIDMKVSALSMTARNVLAIRKFLQK